jgi:hypothetical protein
MENITVYEDHSSPPHRGHRVLDVTAIGEMHRRLLCLDCKLEYEEPAPARDRIWMTGQL